MTRVEYIAIPEETPDTRNEEFYKEIGQNWKKRAQNLRERRWEKIENRGSI